MNTLLLTVMLSSIIFIISCGPTNKKASIATVKTVIPDSDTANNSSTTSPLRDEISTNQESTSSITPINTDPDHEDVPSSDPHTKTVSETTNNSNTIQSLTDDQAIEMNLLRTMRNEHVSKLSDIEKDLDNISEQMLTRPQDLKTLRARQYAQLNQKGNIEKNLIWINSRLDAIYIESGVLEE